MTVQKTNDYEGNDPAALGVWRRQFEHRLGAWGVPLHGACAVFWCLCAAGPAAAVEVGWAPLAIALAGRAPFAWRGYLRAIASGPLAMLCLWALWSILGVAWSADAPRGWHELAYLRWMWVPMVVYPVVHWRGAMITALRAGVILAVLAQGLEAWMLHRGLDTSRLFPHPPSPDALARVSGWWRQPAIGGAVLAAGLGLFLGPAVLGRGVARLGGLAGVVAVGVGMVASGSRGAWMAGAGLIAVGLVVALLFAAWGKNRGAVLGVVGVGAVVAALGAAVVFTPLGERARARAGTLVTELSGAMRAAGDDAAINTDTGGRVVAARAAWGAFLRHPLEGCGTGSFRGEVVRYAAEKAKALEPFRVEKLLTAHNTWLHLLAEGGVVGAGLLAAAWGLAFIQAARPFPGVSLREHLAGGAGAPMWGLLGLGLVSVFETVPYNMSTMAMLCTLLALGMPLRVRRVASSG